MDPELLVLAGSAASAVVTALSTEVWQQARDGLAGLWRRSHPERAEAVAAEADATRNDLADARASGDTAAQDELRAEWQGRIRRLLAADPAAAAGLRALVDELTPHLPQAVPGTFTQNAQASGNARVYQAGQSIHVTERPLP
ncbi:hypothetical protein [Kitasatospora sp. NBC_01539]|uniref:hypothetical protein n=1 Tax=Kitasatospora sp. NBC_01539 TaxID=2903577 RepID=UPI0038602886